MFSYHHADPAESENWSQRPLQSLKTMCEQSEIKHLLSSEEMGTNSSESSELWIETCWRLPQSRT